MVRNLICCVSTAEHADDAVLLVMGRPVSRSPARHQLAEKKEAAWPLVYMLVLMLCYVVRAFAVLSFTKSTPSTAEHANSRNSRGFLYNRRSDEIGLAVGYEEFFHGGF